MNKQKQKRLAATRHMEDDRQQPCESAEDACFAERLVGNARFATLFFTSFQVTLGSWISLFFARRRIVNREILTRLAHQGFCYFYIKKDKLSKRERR